MSTTRFSRIGPLLLAATLACLPACGGGGGGGGSTSATPPPVSESPPPAPTPEPTPEPLTEAGVARFLSQATFGPSRAAIDELLDMGLEAWLLAEFDKPPSLHLDSVLSQFPEDGSFLDERGQPRPELYFLASDSFWQTAIEADDQLRQRMAYALSQIMVVSSESQLGVVPQTMAHYMDVLTAGAFGNYRDLLQAVTYSPAMSIYLTYLRNQRADPATGRVPDENYARELMQLFTIGLVALNPDGTARQGPDGGQVELYDNDDITGLARVFTGLSFSGAPFRAPIRQVPLEAFYQPLAMFNAFHSEKEKTFLGTTIPAGTPGRQSVNLALDALFAHPNVGPFVGRQLIQRFVTSAPTPDYVARVAAAFDRGDYTLPSGTVVGSGLRGDLRAVIAAILFDPQAREATAADDIGFGKLREPVLRFTHWARAFEVNSADAANQLALRDTSRPELLGQHPYRSPSVFNFYRPGYIAPGTATGAAGLTAPELQITNATSIVGYANTLTLYALAEPPLADTSGPASFVPDYRAQAALADDPDALLDNLDVLLTHGRLQPDTRDRITGILAALPAGTPEGRDLRARVASVLVMTSPEYIVLR